MADIIIRPRFSSVDTIADWSVARNGALLQVGFNHPDTATAWVRDAWLPGTRGDSRWSADDTLVVFDIVQHPDTTLWQTVFPADRWGDGKMKRSVTTFVSENDAAAWWFSPEASGGCVAAWVDRTNGGTFCASCAFDAWMERGEEWKSRDLSYDRLRSGDLERTLMAETCDCKHCGSWIIKPAGFDADDGADDEYDDIFVARLGDTVVTIEPNSTRPADLTFTGQAIRVAVGEPGIWWTDLADIREFVARLEELADRGESINDGE
jgi:hypothetical protein